LNHSTDWHLDRIHAWLERMLGYCDKCDRFFVYPKTRRQNTAYVQEELNFIHCCADCFEDVEEQWADLWANHGYGRY
jgi:hypothetical protein